MNPAVLTVAKFWRRGMIWNLLFAFLALTMAKAVDNGLTDSPGINAMVWVTLIAVNIGGQWAALFHSEMFALVPMHARLHSIAVFGILTPLLGMFAFAMFLLGRQPPLHALSGTLVCLNAIHIHRALSLSGNLARLSWLMATVLPLCAWQICCSPQQGRIAVDLALILISVILWSIVLRDRWVNWRPIVGGGGGIVSLQWQGEPIRPAPVVGLLSATRHHLRTWTTLWFHIGMVSGGVIAGAVAAIDPGITSPIAVLFIAGFSFPIFLNIVLMSSMSLHNLAMDRLRVVHRHRAATVILLALIGRHLLLALGGVVGVLAGWSVYRFVDAEAITVDVAWWQWAMLVVLAPMWAAVAAMTNLVVRWSWIAVLVVTVLTSLPMVADSAARRQLEAFVVGNPDVVLFGLAGCAAALCLIAWRRIATVELP